MTCYRCEHVKPAPKEWNSKFEYWCFHPLRLKAPAIHTCDLLETVAGTDEKEKHEPAV